jgi:hypothetical protein
MADDAPLVRYPVKTPAWVWVVVLLTLPAGAALAVPLLDAPGRLTLAMLLVVGAAIASLPCLALWASRAYRVGAPSIDLYRDRVEVPGVWRGRVRFGLAALRLARVRVLQEVSVESIPTGLVLDRGEVVTFIGDGRRRLSDRVFPAPADLQHLIIDLHLTHGGRAPLGPGGWRSFVADISALAEAEQARTTSPDDRELEARLEAELRRDG